MNYIKHVDPAKDRAADKMEVEPLTKKAEMPRAAYGSLLVSMQTSRGLCVRGVKCVRKDKHDGACWPQ